MLDLDEPQAREEERGHPHLDMEVIEKTPYKERITEVGDGDSQCRSAPSEERARREKERDAGRDDYRGLHDEESPGSLIQQIEGEQRQQQRGEVIGQEMLGREEGCPQEAAAERVVERVVEDRQIVGIGLEGIVLEEP